MCEKCTQKDEEIEELKDMLEEAREISMDYYEALKAIGTILKSNI